MNWKKQTKTNKTNGACHCEDVLPKQSPVKKKLKIDIFHSSKRDCFGGITSPRNDIKLPPRGEDRSEQHKIDKVIPNFNCPDLQAVTCEQFVYQICGRDKAEPEHETSQYAGSTHGVDHK